MVEKCSCEVLENLINAIKEASPHFAKTNKYLRQRFRNGEYCRGTMAFNKGIKIIDKAMEQAIEKYAKLKSEGHEQD